MYQKKFNYYHGIMFHHFHDNKVHKRGQGSITGDDLKKIIKYIGKKNIIDADEFLDRHKKKKLKKNQVCFTFDDGIKSQFDVALPILNEMKIKSFFFVYSNLFSGKPDLLEVYRYFRTNYFRTINDFYEIFFKLIDYDLDHFFKINKLNIVNKKIKFPHYSINDIKFRLVRDNLPSSKYKFIMSKLFNKKKFKPKKHFKNLFINISELKKIDKDGHIIGLHSHSHPTVIENLTYEDQFQEYSNNLNILSKILNKNKQQFESMSHPCGSYNNETKNILKKLNIKLGFKQIMTIEKEKNMKRINNSSLEIARQDHADLMSLIRK